ncbi:MAG: hypothetical protein ABW082_15785 [Sedimenticola sp.]
MKDQENSFDLYPGTHLLLNKHDERSLSEKVDKALNSQSPRNRLYLIQAFINRDHSNDPIAAAVAEILKPVLDIDFKEDKGTDNRKGAVARAMGLSKGWPRKTEAELAERELMIEYLQKVEGLSQTVAIKKVASNLDKSNETIRYVKRKKRK